MTRNDSDRSAMKQLKVAACQQGWGRTFLQEIWPDRPIVLTCYRSANYS